MARLQPAAREARQGNGMIEENRVAAVLGDSKVLRSGLADVSRIRERTRRRRLFRAIIFLGSFDLYLWYRYATGNPIRPPRLPADWGIWAPMLILVVLFGVVLLLPLMSGKSPHVMIRPEHIEVGLSEVKGLDNQVDEVIRSINVFLGYATFREVLGGNPRRGILFEGPPGTGKTYLAKAMAKQASVPFLFVSAPAFQSMWFGMTNVRIRSFFKALRKAARPERVSVRLTGNRGDGQRAPDPDAVVRPGAVRAASQGAIRELAERLPAGRQDHQGRQAQVP